jgi:hypothetical protein
MPNVEHWHRKIAGFKVRSCLCLYQRRFRESVARKNLMRQFAFKRRYHPLSAYGLYDLRGHLYFKAYKEKKH